MLYKQHTQKNEHHECSSEQQQLKTEQVRERVCK